MSKPGYLTLFATGELQKRVEKLEQHLASCDVCPRRCSVNRLQDEKGYCRSGLLPVVSSVCDHHGEEPVLSGTRGSGTIFFGNCNLRCVYCQNYQISQNHKVQNNNQIRVAELAKHMIELQDRMGCHNINFVSPSHFVPQIICAVSIAVNEGLHIPLVYNSSGYDSVEIIRLLDGIIDIYLPDIRYSDDEMAKKYSDAPDYVLNSRSAIAEMYRQTGNLEVDDEGVAVSGLIIRHLILPDGIAGSESSLKWIAEELSPEVTISVMSQYSPVYRAGLFPEINRRITKREYDHVVSIVNDLGMENGWLQEMDSSEYYLPDFNTEHHPFEA